MRILTPETAAVAGITRGQLQGPKFRRLFRGVYVDVHVEPTLRVLVAAARALVPDSTVTGITALRLRGASIGADSPVWLATDARVRRDGIITVPAHQPMDGSVASIRRALDDADLRLIDEVITIDELRRLGRLRYSDETELATYRPEAWHLSVANSGSVRESRTRMMLHLSGLPAPRAQYTVLAADGRSLGTVDFAWPAHKVVLEYEGKQHLTDSNQWDKDIRRYEDLEREGWTVIRVTAIALYDPVALMRRVEAALRARGWRGRAPHLGAGWLADVA
ncbi:endonuclease domain-containing protein [Propionibacteriaceae bacterium G1746]|uniref:endonuclease domain-containing protein n=1 Tax=Aestuariimicrobium sp. G57 TaxID=3418485 RepID=UPI003C1C074B